MKTTFLSIIFLMFYFNIYSQNLFGTKWTKVHEERKDGSTIHYEKKGNMTHLEYYFKSINELEIINTIKYSATYKIEKSELTIEMQKFDIEKFNSTELIICEKSELNVTDDKINRYYFINSNKIINYLIEKKLISFVNDSTIISDFFLKPKLKNNKNLSSVLSSSLAKQNIGNGYLVGNFRINNLGKVDRIEISENSKIGKNSVKKFKKALEKILFKPIEIEKVYNQVVNFNVVFKGFSGFFSASIETNTNKIPCINNCNLSFSEKEKAQKFFNNGNLLFTKKKYEKAIESFSNTIKIDSLFFDAYYNRAYTNLTIDNIENACMDWKYLDSMGQIEGSRLYNLKCK